MEALARGAWEEARESFQILGAAAEAERAATVLRDLARVGERLEQAGLSRRDVEVLRLVAQGLSNQEIAAQLVLSKHTVHRHISNILTKLDLPSRAAAAICSDPLAHPSAIAHSGHLRTWRKDGPHG